MVYRRTHQVVKRLAARRSAILAAAREAAAEGGMAAVITILVVNVALGRSLLGSILFTLAIAVGLTPQLLPAIVTVSLSTGANGSPSAR